MPTYKLTSPDGNVYHVTGNGTKEEALAQLQAQLSQTQQAAPPQNPAPSDVAVPAEEATGDKLARWGKEALGGAMYAGHKASAGLTGMLPRAIEEYLVKKGLSPSQEQLDAGQEFVKNTGPASTIGQMGADIGIQLAPSNLIAKAAAPLTFARSVAANLAGQGGLNAALTPTQDGRGAAAGVGAAGTALGGVVSRVLGGPLRTMVSKEGRQLLDEGVTLTPGQAVTGAAAGPGARTLRSTEDKIGSIPFLGDVVRYKTRDAANQFSLNEINKALAPIGAKVSGVGHEALDAASEQISKVYDNVLPDISVPAANLKNLVDNAILQVRQLRPTFSKEQEAVLKLYGERRLQEFIDAGADLSGTTAKLIDREMGEYIRKHRGSVYAEDLSAAFSVVRDAFRNAMVGATPEARSVLHAANTARAKLQPMLASANAATGEFTANKLIQTVTKTGDASTAQRAGAQVLPTVTPDSGTAGRQVLANMVSAPALGAGAAAGAAGGAWPALLAAGGAAAMYTKPGMRYLTEGMHPLAEALQKRGAFPNLSREEAEALMQFLTSQPIRAGFNANNQGG